MDRQYSTQKRQNQLDMFFEQNTLKTNPFGENRSAERAYNRAERLSAALYLLTNHLPIGDSLTQAIRTETLALLKSTLSVRDQMRAPESAQLGALKSAIRTLISLVRMLTVSGSISTQNGSIVIESLDELGNFLVSAQRSPLSESISISREDLEITGPLVRQTEPRRQSIKDIKDVINVKDTYGLKDRSNPVSTGWSPGISSRKQSIMEVLRSSGGDLGIRDISSNVPQYSEKMVQRDLAELVALGLVKRAGLKRWSRYSLK
ncbi:hypothetical protein HY418_02780 [Candidatus Kaiserbacteria bacterium]|nr:hypothetical protein [Candidatus Kaiserbacteria bacterium]